MSEYESQHPLQYQQCLDRMQKRFLDCSNLSLEEAEVFGEFLAKILRDAPFYLGDLARYCDHKWPEIGQQAFPEWMSPGQLARNAGVCRAYPKREDRQHDVTYSQYMQHAGKPDRQNQLATIAEQGLTTDESRRKAAQTKTNNDRAAWLLAIDCNYFIHRFWHSGAGVEAAMQVASWIGRTVERLKVKGLTNVACCFDSHENHRKELTKDWEDRYKDRPPKDPELVTQITLLADLLRKDGFATIEIHGMEADDVMASYAKQFDGRVTLLTQDKDQRQCLSSKCNILLDVEWFRDDTSGDMLPEYKWASAKSHTEETGIPPERWTDFQTIMGDNVDGIRGVEGIGKKGAADLITEFGTVAAVIQAAKDEDDRITAKKREAILEFEPKADVTRQLVTLRTDLPLPSATRI